MTQPFDPKSIETLPREHLTIEVLKKRIAVLERKALKEKKARNLAEKQLERFSLELYQTNQSLKKTLAFAAKKQSELNYLGEASMTVASELPLNDMIRNMVELTCQYCSAEFGFYFVTEGGVGVDGKFDKAWSKESGWQTQSELQELVNANLPLSETDVLESWFISEASDENHQNLKHFGWVVYMNFSLSEGKIGWLAFLSQMELVDEDIFPILATAREHLNSGIRRRLSDRRILKRNLQLMQSEKMASLGQLAAGVAHEINNPIAFIRSNMEVLKDYLKDYKNLHDALKSALVTHKKLDMSSFTTRCEKVDLAYIEEDSADLLTSNIEGLNRVRDIVEDLKGFSHTGDAKQVQMSLNKCIDTALRIAGNVFKYEHQVDNQMTDLCPLVSGNLGQLQQVFVNLFVNAAYAMKGGGALSIFYTEDSQRVSIHVKDTGCGMDQETVGKLFTPFFTTKPVGVGTGLGLSVSYVILEAHDVQVTVDSEIGVGTTFNLSFPVST